ncbi:MAG: transposase [Verrucomicrobiaceae bacterium]|nr:transposase [Verrucomicrobiaceae bacterium]
MPLHLEAFFHILRTGDPWRDLPAHYGLWSTVYSQFRRWCLCGVWGALVAWFGKKARGVPRHVDGSYIKFHQHGLQGAESGREEQSIGLSRGGMTTKLLAAVDEDGLLCDFVLCAGNFHDLTAVRLMLESFRGTHLVGDSRAQGCLQPAVELKGVERFAHGSQLGFLPRADGVAG